jgi:hypothetical protein
MAAEYPGEPVIVLRRIEGLEFVEEGPSGLRT